MANIKFKHINKVYDNNVQAVFDFNLEVKDKEFIVLVGPSGCGKSTTLRMVAGLEEITSGELYIGSKETYCDFKEFDNSEEVKDLELFELYQNVAVSKKAITYKLEKGAKDKSGKLVYKIAGQDKNVHFTSLLMEIKAKKEMEVVISDSKEFSKILLKTTIKDKLSLDDLLKNNKYSALYVMFDMTNNSLSSLKVTGEQERLINNVEPKDRDIAMVFQSYALYPHMTVYNNIAFGLKLRKVKKSVIDERVKNVAEILGLTPYLDRKPAALSGGQRQRVALGRAIVRSPKVFLMDEPLSNLDAKLRVSMRSEIAKIHENVGATTIYVTHDQTEAMTMANRIVIMKDGWIQQIGTPEEVYNLPENIFVGGFIGSPAMNFINCRYNGTKIEVLGKNKKVAYSFTPNKEQLDNIKKYYKNKPVEIKKDLDEIKILLDKEKEEDVRKFILKDQEQFKKDLAYYEKLNGAKSINLILGIRPEDCYLLKDAHNKAPSKEFEMEADVTELLGHELIVYGYLGDNRMIIKLNGEAKVKHHETTKYSFNLNKIHFFDTYSTKRIK